MTYLELLSMAPKYSVNQHPVQTLLSWISSEEIAIPEIQRAFTSQRR